MGTTVTTELVHHGERRDRAGRQQRAAKRAGAGLPAVAPVRFAEVALPAIASASGLEVRLADGTTVRGGSVEELAALAQALRRT